MYPPIGIATDNTCHGRSEVMDEERTEVVKSVLVYLPTRCSFEGHNI